MDGTGGAVVVGGGGGVEWRGGEWWRGGEGVERRGWAVPMEGMQGREGRVDGVVEGR